MSHLCGFPSLISEAVLNHNGIKSALTSCLLLLCWKAAVEWEGNLPFTLHPYQDTACSSTVHGTGAFDNKLFICNFGSVLCLLPSDQKAPELQDRALVTIIWPFTLTSLAFLYSTNMILEGLAVT